MNTHLPTRVSLFRSSPSKLVDRGKCPIGRCVVVALQITARHLCARGDQLVKGLALQPRPMFALEGPQGAHIHARDRVDRR
jgi:hypothetical protein